MDTTALAKTKEYETIAEKREVLHEQIEKALDVVRKFIIRKNLIIYGGMSIDLALKLAGDVGIYSDDVIPDYDFMSPDAYQDSIELANELYKEGFPMISAINAYHITTRRVRVQFRVVADITYVSKKIFDVLPILTFKDLRIIHPLFQRLDFHVAFSYPFANAPHEVIYGRSSKDQTRFRLLDSKYSIRPEKISNLIREYKDATFSKIQFHMPKDCVIGGIAAYAFLYDIMNKLLLGQEMQIILKKSGTLQLLKEEFAKIVPANVDFIENEQFLIQLPKSIEPLLTLISDNPMTLFPPVGSSFYSPSGQKKHKEPEVKVIAEKFYNSYLEIKKRSRFIVIQQNETTQLQIEIIDNRGSYLPCFNFSTIVKELKKYNSSAWTKYHPGDDWKIVNVHNILASLLLPYFSKKKDPEYPNLYWSLMRLVWIAEQIVISLREDKADIEFQKNMPYFLTATTYGKYNLDSTYIATRQESRGEKVRPPSGFYPDKTVNPLPFDPSTSWAFKTDNEIVSDMPEIKF
jgi:hypothetical protein